MNRKPNIPRNDTVEELYYSGVERRITSLEKRVNILILMMFGLYGMFFAMSKNPEKCLALMEGVIKWLL